MTSATISVDGREEKVELRVVIPLACCRSPASSSQAQINILPCRGRLLNSQHLLCCSDAASECTEEEKDAIEGLAQLRQSEDQYRDSSTVANDYCPLPRSQQRVQHDDDSYHDHHREEEESTCSMAMMPASDAAQHFSFNSASCATDNSSKNTGSCRSPPARLAALRKGPWDDSILTRADNDDDRLRPRWRMLADLYAAPLDRNTHNINGEKLENHVDDMDNMEQEYCYNYTNQALHIRELARLREAGDRAGMAARVQLQYCDQLVRTGGRTRQYPRHIVIDHVAPTNRPSASSTKKSKWSKRKSLRKLLDATFDHHQT